MLSPEAETARRRLLAINRQLSLDFFPAVKEVAGAGQQLARAHQSIDLFDRGGCGHAEW